jgi:hypothetical protein
LVEIAATMDEQNGLSDTSIRQANCDGITGAKEFGQWYQAASARCGGNLKGEAWGRVLGRHAREHRKIHGHERSIIDQTRAAIFGWSTSYGSHSRNFTLDPDTFRPIPKPIKQKK